jgi:phosphate transport system protein
MSGAFAPTHTLAQPALVNYLVAMSRAVEEMVERACQALETREPGLAGAIFMAEPRVNEMEILIDEHAVRLLRSGGLRDEDVRFVVATLKINNDLERMGDLAVNIAERTVSLAQMGAPAPAPPPELGPMTAAVRRMVRQSLGALAERDAEMALAVLAADDLVDYYRDLVFERLLGQMAAEPASVAPNLQFVLVGRHLERIADHTTNIAEDVIYWLRGLEVRHGRGRPAEAARPPATAPAARNPQSGEEL